MSKSLYTIRKRKKSKHPQVIVEASRTKFKSMTLTHSKGKRRTKNIRLIKNPNSLDRRDSYVSKRVIEDFKFNFSKAFNNYQLSNEDIDRLIAYLESKKKR